jgi:hypothetical protein
VSKLIEDSGQNLFLQKTSGHARTLNSYKGTPELRLVVILSISGVLL